MGIGGQTLTLRDVKINDQASCSQYLAYVNTSQTTTISNVLLKAHALLQNFFNLFFSVCCFSSLLLFVTGFFFIADLENDGVGEIMVNLITTFIISQLFRYLFCLGFKICLIRSLCTYLVMGSFNRERNTALFPRDIMWKAYIELLI